jgi:phosphoglycerate dehydrogenase-like enzyme
VIVQRPSPLTRVLKTVEMTDRPTAVFAMFPENLQLLFPPRVMKRLAESVDIGSLDEPSQADYLITSWGCPPIDQKVLDRMPKLRAILHAAGTVRGFVTDACWERGLLVSSAAHANAIPVAEYTLAAILLSGKNALTRKPLDDNVGNYGRRVGVIGASRVGRRLLELLHPFELTVSLSDPYVTPDEADALGATLLPLDDLLSTSDVVTLHAPDLPATYRMLDRRRLALIPDGATLINTSRGALIDPIALTDELVSGRLNAVLDVTEPEPLPPDSPLHRLPNVLLTPHIAGSLGNELERLGAAVAEEIERLVSGLPLRHQVLRRDLERVA